MTTQVIKAKSTAFKESVVNTSKNMSQFIMAVALVTVAGYAAYSAKTETNITIFTYLLAAAAALIFVKGMYEVIRSFNK